MKRLALLLALVALTSAASGDDWTHYRGDPRHGGTTGETLPDELALEWEFHSPHAPRPAWSGRDTRMPFDRAFHPVISDGRVFFGNSADSKVYALDATSGKELWTFFCDGPVRFAPAIEGDRLFVVSDDGHLYCLAVDDGRLLWKKHGGPSESRVLGNGRLISRWPARGGPVVDDGIVYFAAGIWPSEGIFIYAVEAESGRTVWCNDRAGQTWTAQPHPGANAASGISAQGHLTLAGDVLLVPTGRAVPAAMDRKTGELLYFHLQKYGHLGGSEILAGGDWFLNGQTLFDVATGERRAAVAGLSPSSTAVVDEGLVHWSAGEVRCLRESDLQPAAPAPCPFGGSALIVAGGKVVSAGPGAEGHGVAVIESKSGQCMWQSPMESEPLGLAVAGDRLYVTTTQGTIHCYGDCEIDAAAVPRQEQPKAANLVFENLALYQKCAEEILRKTGVGEGYCVDLACGDGGLAHALAKQSDLQVYAFESDPMKVAEARRKLDAVGLHGTRVAVLAGEADGASLPDYFADLVVSGRSIEVGAGLDSESEAFRIVRPYGGVACVGRLGEMQVTTRGALEGAGNWTHQYCDPANTNCSTDSLVKGPLGVLWFDDLAFPMPSRHGRGRAPLFLDGRLFVEGLDALLCVSAYNGRKLWEYPLPSVQKVFDGEHLMGTSGTGSNFCVGPTGVYIHTGGECLRIDAASGELLGRFKAPRQPDGTPGTWGVVALDGETLLGTLADTGHLVTYRYQQGDMNDQFTESVLLFAMDAVSGKVLWSHEPEWTIRHNAIAIGDGRVYLIDRPTATGDREREKRIGVPNAEDKHPPGRLVALDAGDGRPVWRTDEDVYGTTLAVSESHDVLLMSYQPWRFKLASELGGRMAAFDSASGERRWDVEAPYLTRPIINGRTIYMQPGAWDLLTGERIEFVFERSYGCGIPSGSTNMLVYRSAVVGYVDLSQDCGTENYGGIRPGCWINAVPAGGLVLMPDATDRCKCSYLNKASIALAPFGLRPPRITPAGTVRREPFEVRLQCDREDAEIRYTLDGSSPTAESLRYAGPLEVDSVVELQARVFADHLPPSAVASARFVVDPDVVPLDDPGWAVVDAAGGTPPKSDWRFIEDYVTERSNLFVGVVGNLDPTVDRPGSYRVYEPGAKWADGEVSLEVASSDDDGLGVAFRYGGTDRYYVWSMDRQRGFRILGCKEGETYRMLARNKASYEKDRWYSVRVVLDGAKITVFVDGEKDLEAVDETLAEGTIALYAWGCAGAKFRNVGWKAK